MKIGYRTIKTAIGAPIAITIAQLLGLQNFATAGILTMLCIQPSRKRSVLTAWDRFLACVTASLFSFVFFELLGYNTVVLGLMLALFIPTTVVMKITQGIMTSSVIIINLFISKHIDYVFLFNQFMLILVGIGVGLLVNLYMPSMDKTFREKQKKLERNFRIILLEISSYIRNKNEIWDGKEIAETQEMIDKAADLIEVDKENHMLRSEHTYHDYFMMRKKQFDLLKRMLPLVARLPNHDTSSDRIADFFEKLSNAVHPGNTAALFLGDLAELRKSFYDEDLPRTREEFETKANLFRLLHEIEDYLLIKKRFKKSDIAEGKKQKKKTAKN